MYVDKHPDAEAGTLISDGMKILKIIENMALGAGLHEALRGAGPPQV